MHPILFQLGPFEIRSWGVMFAISCVVGAWFAQRRARNQGVNPNLIMNLTLVIVGSALIGSRFFYVAFHWNEFAPHPLDIISPYQSTGEWGIGGLSMIGGVVLAFLTSLLYLHLKGEDPWKFADVVAPSFPLGIFFTRIGCFLNGCCFGKPSSLPFAVTFPLQSPAGLVYPHRPLHPTQLYSSLYGLGILGLLLYLERYKRFSGFTTWLMVGLYCFARFLVDFLRYYEESMALMRIGGIAFSVNQGVCLATMLVAGVGWNLMRIRQKGGRRENPHPAAGDPDDLH